MKRTLFIFALWCLSAGTAFCQGARKDDIVFNAQGRPMAGATVRVCTSAATGQPCSPLASIYSDAALTILLANPLNADGLGNYTFYAAPGRYEIEISGPGIITKQMPDVTLPSDPNSPTFTSVTTTSGISAFSLSLAGNLTVSGSAAVTGALTAGGNLTATAGQNQIMAYKYNTTFVVDDNKYPCTSAGINQAITDAIAAGSGTYPGGVVDARACGGNRTMSAEINIGDASQHALLFIGPNGAQWTFTQADGSCGIKQFGGSTIEGPAKGGGGLAGRWVLRRGSTSSLLATYCTAFAASGSGGDSGYFRAGGFLVYSPTGDAATTSGYGAIFAGIYDDSVFDNIGVADAINSGAWVYGMCCASSFYGLTVNSGGGVGLTIGKSGSNTTNVAFYNASIDHPKSGDNAIIIDQTSTSGIIANIAFYTLYGEGTITGQIVPYMDIGQNVFGVLINGSLINMEVSTATPAIQLESLNSFGFFTARSLSVSNETGPAVNNIKNGQTCVGFVSGMLSWLADCSFGSTFFGASDGSDGLKTDRVTLANLVMSRTAPTISSGFGTTPSIASNNGTASFTVNVGTGGTASSGVIGLPTATNGWNCTAFDATNPATDGGYYVKQTAGTTTTATLTGYNTAGAPTAWTASDILSVSCFAR